MPGGEVFLIGAIVGFVFLLVLLALFAGGAVWALGDRESATHVYVLTASLVLMANLAALRAWGWDLWTTRWSPWMVLFTALTAWTLVVAPVLRWGRHRLQGAGKKHSWSPERLAKIKWAVAVLVVVAIALAIAAVRDRAGAFMSGRVVDEAGRPVPGLEVGLLDESFDWYGGRGEPTEADGSFRIGPLHPGRYFLAARPSARTPVPAELASEGLGYVFTFHPGSPSPAGAQMLSFQEGEDLSGMDITIAQARTPRVSGVVTMPDGEPASRGRVNLGGESWYRPLQVADVGADGTFAFPAVWPGFYRLSATTGSGGICAARAITVTEEDIDGIQLAMAPAGRITGRVTAPGMPDYLRDMPQVVSFWDAKSGVLGGGNAAEMRPNGTFTIAGPCGLARLVVEDLPPEWTVQRISLGERDITDVAVDFRSEAEGQEVEVVLVPSTTGLKVQLIDAETRVAARRSVIVFSADPSRWTAGSRFIAVGYADGEISFRGLPAGDYFVATFGRMALSVFRYEILEYLSAIATPVRLEDGETATITVEVS